MLALVPSDQVRFLQGLDWLQLHAECHEHRLVQIVWSYVLPQWYYAASAHSVLRAYAKADGADAGGVCGERERRAMRAEFHQRVRCSDSKVLLQGQMLVCDEVRGAVRKAESI